MPSLQLKGMMYKVRYSLSALGLDRKVQTLIMYLVGSFVVQSRSTQPVTMYYTLATQLICNIDCGPPKTPFPPRGNLDDLYFQTPKDPSFRLPLVIKGEKRSLVVIMTSQWRHIGENRKFRFRWFIQGVIPSFHAKYVYLMKKEYFRSFYFIMTSSPWENSDF